MSSSESPADVLARHPKPVTIMAYQSGEGTWTLRLSAESEAHPEGTRRLTDFGLLKRLVQRSESGGVIDWTGAGEVVQLNAADLGELMTGYRFLNLFFGLSLDEISDGRSNVGRWKVRIEPPGVISHDVNDITDDETLKRILLAEARKRADPMNGE